MKTNHIMFLSLAVFAVCLLTTPQLCSGEDGQEHMQRKGDMQRSLAGRHKMGPKRIEKILQHISESNPEKAEELRVLKEENPAEFRKAMQQMFAKKHGKMMDKRGFEDGHEGHRFDFDQHSRRCPEDKGGRGDRMDRGDRMGTGNGPTGAQIFDWLKKTYPEKAKRLAELKRNNPILFRRLMLLNLKKYRRIVEAVKENPKLAQALKREMELREKRGKILKQLKNTTDENQKQQLAGRLKEVISDRFDVILQRKQAVYNQMLKKLDELKKEVEKHKAELDRHRDPDFKNKNVDARLQKLMEQTEEFKWD